MSKSSIPRGFTLIETVAALAIASLALLSLLQLQLTGIRTADQAQGMTRAVLLAQEKMAEAISAGYPPAGVRMGIVEADGDQFTWRTEVTEARAPLRVLASETRPSPRSGPGPDRLRRLSVDVSWQRGPGAKRICLTTYMAENRIRAG
jgi:type II secretion system protein I